MIEPSDPSGIVATWWPVVAILLPFVQATVQHPEAKKYVKQGLAVAFAVIATVVSVLGFDWDVLTPAMIAERIVVLWGGAQATFWLVRGLAGDPGSWLFPTVGVGSKTSE